MEKTNSQLSEAELRYKTLFEQSPDGIVIIDTSGKILEFNETAHRQLGYSKEEFAALKISDIDAFENPEETRDSIRRVLDEGRAEFEVTHRTKDGEIRDVQVITQVLVLSGQTVFHTIWRDITERKQIERELEFFRDLINKSNDAIFVNDPQTGLFIIVNDRACISLGYDREELLKMGVKDIETTFPDNFSWEKHVNELRRRGSLMLEGINKRKDGAVFPVETNVSYVVLDTREYMVAVVRDITERKQAEKSLRDSAEALKQANARFQTLLHTIPDTVFFKDAEGRYLLVNKAFEASLGFDESEIIGKTDEQLLPPDIAEGCRKSDEEVIRGNKIVYLEDEIYKNNEKRFLDTIKVPLYDKDKGCMGVVGVIHDVTERKKTEEALRQSREFIKTILDTVDEAFIVIDKDYRIIMMNSAYGRQTNMPVEDIIGRHCYEISHHSDKPCYEQGEECAVRHSFEKGEPYTCVHRHSDKDGNVLYVETKSYPLRDASGETTSAIEVINNITDKHLLEEQILRTQKLEAVGLLAGGIAHDFNNLLQGVFGNISMAKMLSEKDSTVYQMLGEAERALNLSRNLTRQLLTFSKGGEPSKRVISLPSIIQDSVKFSLSGSNVRYSFSVDEDLWPVEADEGQISQVINNIVLNAGDAMPEGGTIEIKVRNVLIEDRSILPLKNGKYVKIAIKDSGIGIPHHHVSKIFDPYFTTKQKGSGLGLATSYSIIKKHGGILDVTSELGAGSTFFIYLPASEKKLPAAKAEVEGLLTGKGRILVMDDEEIIRIVTGQMLRTLGYEVVFTENGEQAVEKYSEAIRSNKPFDAVILDLTIRGGMGGQETVKKMIEIDPAIKAIVSSGYTEGPIVSHYMDEGFKARLSKPYEIEELSKTLNRILMLSDK